MIDPTATLTRPALATALASAWLAFAPDAAGQETVDAGSEIVVESSWTEIRSLALFEACDRNADDRLDVFEIRHVLVDLQGTRDPARFRRLDTDASGFMEWPEFDQRFKTSLERAGEFRLRPYRTPPDLRDPSLPASDVDPTESVVAMYDGDLDGLLSRAELREFLRRMHRNPDLAERFGTLDVDDSGLLTVTEFAPILQFVPEVWDRVASTEELRRGLPADFRGADRDLNGVIDRNELQSGLARIHPSLARWTEQVLGAADRTRNDTLGSTELNAARAKARAALGG